MRPLPPLATALLIACISPISTAQVVTDGTLGRAGPRTGPNYTIPASLGTQRGPNLFHSFSAFNLRSTESATFSAPAGAGVRNIIARVTSGTPSSVDGLLRSSIPNADLYFINPAGVAFGPNARLDVQGSLHVSSASAINLADGVVFSAAPGPSDALLTSAPVASFGFLPGVAPGPITATGSQLTVPRGKTLTLVGGKVTLSAARLQAVGGRVTLTAVAAPAAPSSVSVTTAEPGTGPRDAVTIGDGSRVDAPLGGRVQVRASDLTVDASTVVADTDAVPGGGVDLSASGALTVRNGQVSVRALGTADAGTLRLTADTLTVAGLAPNNDGAVVADTAGSGRGGSIVVSVRTLAISDQGRVAALTSSSGPGGDIAVSASESITITGEPGKSLAGIAAETTATSTGPGGNITVATPTLTLLNTGEITSTTKSTGRAGDIRITTTTLLADGNNSPVLTGVQARVGNGEGDFGATGAGGSITLTTSALTLRNGAVITATSFGQGPAGSLTVTGDDVTLTGSAGPNPPPFTGLFARTTRPDTGGPGGDLALSARALTLTGNAQIAATSTGSGRGGNVAVTATGPVSLRDASQITAAATSSGDAGTVSLTAPSLRLGGSAAVSSQSALSSGGSVTLALSGPATLADASAVTSTAALTAGDVVLTTPAALTLSDAARISARTAGAAPDATGGSLRLTAGSASVARGTQLSTAADGQGRTGGSIALTTTAGALLLSGSASSEATGTGVGGDVRLSAFTDLIVASGAQVRASSASNAGGNIALSAGRDLTADRAQVTARAAGTGGEIRLAAGAALTLSARTVLDAQAQQLGNIFATAGARLSVTDSALTARAATTGGRIVLSAPGPRSAVLVSRSTIDGRAGGTDVEVSVRTPTLLLSTDSLILTDRPDFSPDTTLASALSALDDALSGPPLSLTTPCAVLYLSPRDSSFTYIPRATVPPAPDGPLALPWPSESPPAP